jgi:hypothetical protein
MPAPKVVRIDPEAEEEIAAGIDWYEQRQPGLGGDFLDEVGAALTSLQLPDRSARSCQARQASWVSSASLCIASRTWCCSSSSARRRPLAG